MQDESKQLEKLEDLKEEVFDALADLEDGITENKEAIKTLTEEVKKKSDQETVFEIDPESIRGAKGDNYVLTDSDKDEIASKIKVPVVEKIIERTEVVHEKPIITEKITQEIKEVAVKDTGAEIVSKVNELEIKPELQIDASHIKNLPRPSVEAWRRAGGIGIETIKDEGTTISTSARTLNFVGATVAATGTDTVTVTVSGSDVDTFLELTDTPDSYAGQTLKSIRVNAGETGLEFFTPSAGYTDEEAQDAVGGMVDTTLEYVDATPLLRRAALTGDITASAGSNSTTLATVNSNVGTFGSATQVPQFTVNGKGLVTAVSNITITQPVDRSVLIYMGL